MSKLIPSSIRKAIVPLLLCVLSGVATSATMPSHPKNPMPPKVMAKFVRLNLIDAKTFFGTDETSKSPLYEAQLEIIAPGDVEAKNIANFLVERDPAHVATDDSWRPLGLTVEEKVRTRYQQIAEAYLLAHDGQSVGTSAEELSSFVPNDVLSLLEQQFPIAKPKQNTITIGWRFSTGARTDQTGYHPAVGMLASYEGDANGGRLTWKGQEGWCGGDGYPAPKSTLLASIQTLTESKGTPLLFAMGIGVLLALCVGILGWLAPIFIAKRRGHPNLVPIAIITVLLGWTFIGWAVCLAWSFWHTDSKQRTTVSV